MGLRLVPLFFALCAAGFTLTAARRVCSEPFAILATAAILFDPVAIEFLRAFKPFGGELAAVSAILLVFTLESFPLLAATVALAAWVAYPTFLLVPGLLLFLPRRNAIILGVISATEAALLYWFMIRPNTAPVLWEYWSVTPLWPPALVLAAAAIGIILLRHNAFAVICLITAALAALSAILGWYPASQRTWLFLRPCLVLPLAIFAEQGRPTRSIAIKAIAYAAAASIAVNGIAAQVIYRTNLPFEGYAELVKALEPRTKPGDLILVHANAQEGFRLHARLAGWNPKVTYGATGWPCCRRGVNTPRGSATRNAVQEDLASMIPDGFSGRIWLVFGNRPLHWDYIGLDEGELWRTTLWEHGCPPGPYMDFGNLVLSPMQCSPYSR